MKHYLKIFVFIVTFSNLYTQESQNTLAVLDFEGRGINSLEAATLTDRFTSEIGKKRWSPKFGQRVKLDSDLTWKDMES